MDAVYVISISEGKEFYPFLVVDNNKNIEKYKRKIQKIFGSDVQFEITMLALNMPERYSHFYAYRILYKDGDILDCVYPTYYEIKTEPYNMISEKIYDHGTIKKRLYVTILAKTESEAKKKISKMFDEYMYIERNIDKKSG